MRLNSKWPASTPPLSPLLPPTSALDHSSYAPHSPIPPTSSRQSSVLGRACGPGQRGGSGGGRARTGGSWNRSITPAPQPSSEGGFRGPKNRLCALVVALIEPYDLGPLYSLHSKYYRSARGRYIIINSESEIKKKYVFREGWDGWPQNGDWWINWLTDLFLKLFIIWNDLSLPKSRGSALYYYYYS